MKQNDQAHPWLKWLPVAEVSKRYQIGCQGKVGSRWDSNTLRWHGKASVLASGLPVKRTARYPDQREVERGILHA